VSFRHSAGRCDLESEHDPPFVHWCLASAGDRLLVVSLSLPIQIPSNSLASGSKIELGCDAASPQISLGLANAEWTNANWKVQLLQADMQPLPMRWMHISGAKPRIASNSGLWNGGIGAHYHMADPGSYRSSRIASKWSPFRAELSVKLTHQMQDVLLLRRPGQPAYWMALHAETREQLRHGGRAAVGISSWDTGSGLRKDVHTSTIVQFSVTQSTM